MSECKKRTRFSSSNDQTLVAPQWTWCLWGPEALRTVTWSISVPSCLSSYRSPRIPSFPIVELASYTTLIVCVSFPPQHLLSRVRRYFSPAIFLISTYLRYSCFLFFFFCLEPRNICFLLQLPVMQAGKHNKSTSPWRRILSTIMTEAIIPLVEAAVAHELVSI